MEKHHIVSPHGPEGEGLFLAWKNKVEIKVLSSSNNFIDTEITFKGVSFQTTFVYGEPDHTKRQAVWKELLNLAPTTGEPWFLTVDFNEIIDNSEKEGGPARAEGTFCGFQTFLSRNGLFDLKHSGNYLSWRGKRHSHLVFCRLDRAISNKNWTELFPLCRSQYLKFEGFDHCQILSFMDPKRKKGNCIFRFDGCLRGNEEVKKLISDIWSRHFNLGVEARLTLYRKAISKWSKVFQINSQKEIASLKQQLKGSMSDPNADDS
ncbi:hypothetical protein N665_1258s0004 [Sinapis alba]|nr:hypothetical protein N665_1258s0004 [Sinapis alba]